MEVRVRQAIADDQACILLRLVLENPGISPEQLADRARTDQAVVRQCLESHVAVGLIEQDSGAGYSVTEAAKPAVIRHLPLNYQCPGLLR